jgi:hypothetical protein
MGGDYFVKEIGKDSQCWLVWNKKRAPGTTYADAVLAFLVEVKAAIENAPTVNDKAYATGYAAGSREGYKKGIEDARPTGEWIKHNFNNFGALGDWDYRCINCNALYGGQYNFCPNCGAKMQKEASR